MNSENLKNYRNMEEKNFEEMRNQFAILKEQLKNQEIVNDHLLRETMKAKNKDISSTKRMVYGCAVIGLLLFPMNYLTHTWSLAFTIFTTLILFFCAIATYYIHKPVEELNFMRDDFSTVARVMARFKKQYDNWLHYVSPVIIIPFIIWACYEIAWKNAPEDFDLRVRAMLLLPIFIGAGIGFLVGYHYHRKAVNAAQDIIDQIEE